MDQVIAPVSVLFSETGTLTSAAGPCSQNSDPHASGTSFVLMD